MSEATSTVPGLTTAEANLRYVDGQSNAVSIDSYRSPRQFLLDSVFSVFNFDLLGISLALWLLGRPRDALVSALVLLFNVSVSTVLGYRNWRQVERLLALTESEASVLRDNTIKAIDPDRLVPGDAVIISQGDQFFVDGTLLGTSSMRVDEYLVNGSEMFITREAGEAVYAGSFCVTGHGVYEATAVGEDRRWAAIAPQQMTAAAQRTPLQQLISRILSVLRVLVLLMVGVLLLRYFFTPEISDDAYDLYTDAVAIIFTIAPSGLLFMILIAYSAGAARLGPLGAIVRRPSTIEALAQTEVLCLGKTGTLTGGEAELQSLSDETDETAISDTRLRQMVGSFARSARTMTPLLQVLARSFDGARFDPLHEAPLLSLVGWQALCFDSAENGGTYVLGFERFVQPLLDPAMAVAPAEDDRHNPLLFAFTPNLNAFGLDNKWPTPPSGLTPLARIYLSEAVHEEAIATTQAFLDAGIDVKILSSDSIPAVTKAAQSAGLVPTDVEEVPTVSGRDLQSADEDGLFQRVQETVVFGRLSPHQKEVVVEMLRDHDVQVAMVGETVMEVPAMRSADIAITMRASNQAAIGEADIILLDNDLQALPAILEVGQGVFNRLLDALKLSLSHTFLVFWLVLVAFLAGPYYFPYTRGDTLPIVLFTITIPSLVLSFWLVSGNIDADNLGRRLLYFVLPASLTMTLLVMAVFLSFEWAYNVFYARTAVAHTLILAGLILIIFVQPPNRFWAGGDSVSGDYRPVRLVVVLYLVFLVMSQSSLYRPSGIDFVDPLRSAPDLFAVWGITAVWALALRMVWRSPSLRRLSRFSVRRSGDILRNDSLTTKSD